MRIEQCHITNGEGLFDLQCSGESILYYNHKPFAYEWADNKGSIGKYLARSNTPIEINKSLEHIRYYADNGMHEDVKLADAIYPLLQLLSNGTYELMYPFTSQSFGFDLIEFENKDLINFYPTELTLICLQPLMNLDPVRVDYFKEKINKGVKPVIFVLGAYEAGDKFILDGHHKAYAYNELNIEPTILFIKRKIDPNAASESSKGEVLKDIYSMEEIARNKILSAKYNQI